MSEIRDRAKTKVKKVLELYAGIENPNDQVWSEMAGTILRIPEIAIVDRGAELPDARFRDWEGRDYQLILDGFREAMAMVKRAGWVKEIK